MKIILSVLRACAYFILYGYYAQTLNNSYKTSEEGKILVWLVMQILDYIVWILVWKLKRVER